ncbi:MAG: tRNA (guanosine(46)-N7)-methyltransferase TrmB [Bacteroidota bacterium]
MSKRNKLQKFSEMYAFPHVYENFTAKNPQLSGKDGAIVKLKGQWAAKHFQNNHPITLELACGKGDYTLGLAKRYPERNFIGVDIKGARIWRGAKTALEEGLDNVAFLRTRIEQLHYFFEPEEVAEIWITFPDPFLKKENRRLTAPRFLEMYHKLITKEGILHLKTDSPDFYKFTLEVLEQVDTFKLSYAESDIYSKALLIRELEIKTFYEHKHLADHRKIKYVKMLRNDDYSIQNSVAEIETIESSIK